MASYIRRRKFLATLGGATSWPLAARAQPVFAGNRYRDFFLPLPRLRAG
jgi:hypothetical protein